MTVEVFGKRPEVAVACGCVLGEGAIWDHRLATLYWVDINGETLWSWRPGSHEEGRARQVGQRVGFVLLTEDPGTVVLGLKSGLARMALAGGEMTMLVRPEPELPGNRLNDGVVAPDGSVYFGSLNETGRQPNGRFYHWANGNLSGFGGGTVTTNGPAIDAERGVLYATDTSRGRVDRYRLADEGRGEPEQFVEFREGDGHPDGMAVDAEGYVWICHFRGARITRFDPAGRAVLLVPMPTSQVTKLAFGGPDLTTIYVTTAARDLDREIDPLAGHVFTFDAGVPGQTASICRV